MKPELSAPQNSIKRHILVATPLGLKGKGGIDRLMDSVNDELVALADPSIVVEFLPTRGGGNLFQSLFLTGKFAARMIACRLGGAVCVVHLNVAGFGSTWRKMALAFLARVLGLPYILHLHGGIYKQFFATRNGVAKYFIRQFFNKANRVLVLGNTWRDFVKNQIGLDDQKITIFRNATPRPSAVLARKASAEIQLAFLGVLNANKGVPVLLEALGTVETNSAWHATIAGSGEIENAKSLAKTFGIENRVSFPGWVGAKQIDEILRDADVFVLPSFIENLPMSVIEAMGAGLAVVTTPVGAVEDIIEDGVTGLLVPPGDSAALAMALKKLIDDPILRKRLGQAAQKFHRENLEIGPYVIKLVDIWRRALGE